MLAVYFHVKVRTSRGTPIHWQSWCITCQRIRVRESRGFQRRSAPMTAEEKRAKKREAYRRMMDDPVRAEAHREKRRRYQRELGRMKRIEQGVTPRGPWRKYRQEVGAPVGSDRVPAGPFIEWADANPDEVRALRAFPSLDRGVRRVRTQDNVSLGLVDSVGSALGDPDLVNRLYPYE